MNNKKNKLKPFLFIVLYLGFSLLNSELLFAQSGGDAPAFAEFEGFVDPNPPPEKTQDEIKAIFSPLKITLNANLGLEEYQSRKEGLQDVKVYSAQWVAYVKKHNEDLEKAQIEKFDLDKAYRKNRTETVGVYKEEHKNMEEEKKYTEEASAKKNEKKDLKKGEKKSKLDKKREAEDLKLKKKYAADPEKLKEKQDELQLKREGENEKKTKKDGFVLEKYNQRKKNNPLKVQEKIDNLDQSFDKVLDSLDSKYERQSAEIDEKIANLKAENSEEMKRYTEIQELDYDIRLSIGLAIKGIDDIHHQYGKEVDKMLDGLTVSKFYDELTGEIVNQPFLDELVENIFYTDRKIDVESVSISRLISNYTDYGIEGKQGAVGFRINLDKDYVLMLLDLQVDGKKALLFRKTDVKEDYDALKEQEAQNRAQVKADYQMWLEQRNAQHEEQIQQLTAEYEDISSDLLEEQNPEILLKKLKQYISLRKRVNHRLKLIQIDNSSEEKLQRIKELHNSIQGSMTYTTQHIDKVENERKSEISQTLSKINDKLAGIHTSDIYNVETGQFTDLEFIENIKEFIFFSASPANIETSMLSRIIPNPASYGMNPLMPARGYRINIDDKYDLLILKLENGEIKAVMLKRAEIPLISELEQDVINIELAENAAQKTAKDLLIEQNLRELNERLATLTLADIYDKESKQFTDTEFIEKLKANIFYSRTETTISTSGVGRIIPDAQKQGMNPLLAAKGYRFNMDSEHDLVVVKLENGQIEAVILNRNELATISTAERDELNLHLAQDVHLKNEREAAIEQNLQEISKKFAGLQLADIYDVENEQFTDTEFIEKLKATIFYSQIDENISTSGVGRIIPNAQKHGMNPKMAAKGYRFNMDSEHDLAVVKLENGQIKAVILDRNELATISTAERDELNLHLAQDVHLKNEREVAIEQNLQEISKKFAGLQLADIYDTENEQFTDTEFIEKLKANIFYSQMNENISTTGVGRIILDAQKHGMNPKMAAQGYRFNINPKYDLLVVKLENNEIQAVVQERNELAETLYQEEISYWDFDEHHLAQKQDSSNRAFLIEAQSIHQSIEIEKSDSLDLESFNAKIDELALLQNHLNTRIRENNQSAWAMPSVKPLDSLRAVVAKQVKTMSVELTDLQNQRKEHADSYLTAQFELSKIYNEEKKEFVDLDYLKELGNTVFYSKKSPSIETTGLGKLIPDVAYYGVNPKVRTIGHRININPDYDLIIVKLETGTKYAIIWNKTTLKTLDAWNLNL